MIVASPRMNRSKCMGGWTAAMLLSGAIGGFQCEIDNIDRQLGKGSGCACLTIDETGGTWTHVENPMSATLELRFTSWKGGDYILLAGGVNGPPPTCVSGQVTVTATRLWLAAIPVAAIALVAILPSSRVRKEKLPPGVKTIVDQQTRPIVPHFAQSQTAQGSLIVPPSQALTDTHYVEFLLKLEDLKSRGQISEKTYKKLREEFRKRVHEDPH